jgi:hypothetical protein
MEEIQNKRGRAFLFALLGREVSLVWDVSKGTDSVVKNRYEDTFKNDKKISAKFKYKLSLKCLSWTFTD